MSCFRSNKQTKLFNNTAVTWKRSEAQELEEAKKKRKKILEEAFNDGIDESIDPYVKEWNNIRTNFWNGEFLSDDNYNNRKRSRRDKTKNEPETWNWSKGRKDEEAENATGESNEMVTENCDDFCNNDMNFEEDNRPWYPNIPGNFNNSNWNPPWDWNNFPQNSDLPPNKNFPRNKNIPQTNNESHANDINDDGSNNQWSNNNSKDFNSWHNYYNNYQWWQHSFNNNQNPTQNNKNDPTSMQNTSGPCMSNNFNPYAMINNPWIQFQNNFYGPPPPPPRPKNKTAESKSGESKTKSVWDDPNNAWHAWLKSQNKNEGENNANSISAVKDAPIKNTKSNKNNYNNQESVNDNYTKAWQNWFESRNSGNTKTEGNWEDNSKREWNRWDKTNNYNYDDYAKSWQQWMKAQNPGGNGNSELNTDFESNMSADDKNQYGTSRYDCDQYEKSWQQWMNAQNSAANNNKNEDSGRMSDAKANFSRSFQNSKGGWGTFNKGPAQEEIKNESESYEGHPEDGMERNYFNTDNRDEFKGNLKRDHKHQRNNFDQSWSSQNPWQRKFNTHFDNYRNSDRLRNSDSDLPDIRYMNCHRDMNHPRGMDCSRDMNYSGEMDSFSNEYNDDFTDTRGRFRDNFRRGGNDFAHFNGPPFRRRNFPDYDPDFDGNFYGWDQMHHNDNSWGPNGDNFDRNARFNAGFDDCKYSNSNSNENILDIYGKSNFNYKKKIKVNNIYNKADNNIPNLQTSKKMTDSDKTKPQHLNNADDKHAKPDDNHLKPEDNHPKPDDTSDDDESVVVTNVYYNQDDENIEEVTKQKSNISNTTETVTKGKNSFENTIKHMDVNVFVSTLKEAYEFLLNPKLLKNKFTSEDQGLLRVFHLLPTVNKKKMTKLFEGKNCLAVYCKMLYEIEGNKDVYKFRVCWEKDKETGKRVLVYMKDIIPSTLRNIPVISKESLFEDAKKNVSDTVTATIKPMTTTYHLPSGRLNQEKKSLIRALVKPVESTVAERMMKLMGWSGGALGSKEDGIKDPIMPHITNKPLLGYGQPKLVTQPANEAPPVPKRVRKFQTEKVLSPVQQRSLFRTKVLQHILEFVNDDQRLEVAFDMELNNNHRKEIHRIVESLNFDGDEFEFDNTEQMELVKKIKQDLDCYLVTESEGATEKDRQLFLYKSSQEKMYLITPHELVPQENNDVVLTRDNFIRKKLLLYLSEFANDPDTDMLKFLGEFEPADFVVIKLFFTTLQTCMREGKLCKKLVKNIFESRNLQPYIESDKYKFNIGMAGKNPNSNNKHFFITKKLKIDPKEATAATTNTESNTYVGNSTDLDAKQNQNADTTVTNTKPTLPTQQDDIIVLD